MNLSNLIINWQNGCQEQEHGENVSQALNMVGQFGHFTRNATRKKPSLVIVKVVTGGKKLIFGGYCTERWARSYKF
jgi:hypothetical protein